MQRNQSVYDVIRIELGRLRNGVRSIMSEWTKHDEDEPPQDNAETRSANHEEEEEEDGQIHLEGGSTTSSPSSSSVHSSPDENDEDIQPKRHCQGPKFRKKEVHELEEHKEEEEGEEENDEKVEEYSKKKKKSQGGVVEPKPREMMNKEPSEEAINEDEQQRVEDVPKPTKKKRVSPPLRKSTRKPKSTDDLEHMIELRDEYIRLSSTLTPEVRAQMPDWTKRKLSHAKTLELAIKWLKKQQQQQ